MEARIGVRRDALDALTRSILTETRRLISLRLTISRLGLLRMFGTLRPNLLCLDSVRVDMSRTDSDLRVDDLIDHVLLLRIFRSVACTGADATCLVDVDETGALADNACLILTLEDLGNYVRRAIDERSRVHLLEGMRATLRIVTALLRVLDLTRGRI